MNWWRSANRWPSACSPGPGYPRRRWRPPSGPGCCPPRRPGPISGYGWGIRCSARSSGARLRSCAGAPCTRRWPRRPARPAGSGPRTRSGSRSGIWKPERCPSQALLVAAAGWALAALDYQLAEQFCRAAGEAGPGWPAERLLAQALVGQGKAGPAEDLLSGQFAQARTDAERTEIAGIRALNLYWGLNRPEQARSRARPGRGPRCGSRRSAPGWTPCAAGSCCTRAAARRSLAVLDPVLADPQVPQPGDAGGDGHGDHGAGGVRPLRRRDRYRGHGACSWPGQRQAKAGCWRWTSWPPPRPSPTCGVGSSPRRPALAESGYQRALEVRSPPNVAVWALVRGQLAAARGAMTEASVWLREAIATLGGPAPLHPYQGSIARAGLDALARVAAHDRGPGRRPGRPGPGGRAGRALDPAVRYLARAGPRLDSRCPRRDPRGGRPGARHGRRGQAARSGGL